MMKAAVLVTHGEALQFQDIAIEEPGENEVLIRLDYAGVCHTDLHLKDGEFGGALPLVLGHEGVGHVVKLGPGVDLSLGDRVCTSWMYSACGSCKCCVTGWEPNCHQKVRTGYEVNGTYAEYIRAKANFVVPVPASLSSEQAVPISCAGVTTYKALKMSRVQPGEWVAIVGAAGGLGHLAVQYAKAMGAKIVAIDTGDDKMAFMKSLGADVTIDYMTSDVAQEVLDATGGGTQATLLLANSKSAFQATMSYSAPLATIVQIAVSIGTLEVAIPTIVDKCLTIRGSCIGTRQDLEEALAWAAEGKVRCHVEVCKFTEVNAVLDAMKAGQVLGRRLLDLRS